MKLRLIPYVLAIVLSSCNFPSKNPVSEDVSVVDGEKELNGKWLQPIPGQEDKSQGFELNNDKTASTINTNTMEYEKWKSSKDTLYIWGHTIGVKKTSAFVDTLIIKSLSDSELVISRLGSVDEDQEIFHKAK